MFGRMYDGSVGNRSRLALAWGLLFLLAALSVPTSARAALHDRGNGMIYDDDKDVTYLYHANYAKAVGYVTGAGRVVASTNGAMTLPEAREFVGQLVYGGYDDWRLPTSSYCYLPDVGFNRLDSRCGDGELKHLFDRELFRDVRPFPVAYFCSPWVRMESGNDAYVQPTWWDDCTGQRVPEEDRATYAVIDPFQRFIVPDLVWGSGMIGFWSESPVPNPYPSHSWITMYSGLANTAYSPSDLHYVWAVRSGDVNVVVDADSDGVPDNADNCPSVANTNQTDNDADGHGDACDTDDDNDTHVDGADNCPLVANADQADSDRDGLGDSCDSDLDDDGLSNDADNCRAAANPDQTDTDSDGAGDECDLNDDGDAYPDSTDNCPAVFNDGQEDLDGDGIGDFCDSDLDGDGTGNETDNCPLDANVGQDDADGDRAGDACDADDDNDGVGDSTDNCPLMVNASQGDQDGDNLGDVCDGDLDGDGAANGVDNCPVSANPDQRDFDVDALGDACDPDADGDGVANVGDSCAWSTAGQVVDAGGCSIAQLSPCSGPPGTVMPWRNKGKYVSSVAHSAKRFAESGLISTEEQAQIVATAGASTCGQ